MAIRIASYLKRNRFGVFYFRRVIPPDLHPNFAFRQISRSMRTSNTCAARGLALRFGASVELLFSRLRDMAKKQKSDQVEAELILKLDFDEDGTLRSLTTDAKPEESEAASRIGANLINAVLGRGVEKFPLTGPSLTEEIDKRHLSNSATRTEAIAINIIDGYRQGRKLLVLTERTAHLDAIRAALGDRVGNLFILHGRMSKKQRAELIGELEALSGEAPRVLLATGKLVGEGFDHPPLDTLVLAMPISWKGTLQQYAGRLHREHTTKADVRIYDYVDIGHPALMRMWDKRQRGYRAMEYQVREPGKV